MRTAFAPAPALDGPAQPSHPSFAFAKLTVIGDK
jgi:hypothetical protein